MNKAIFNRLKSYNLMKMYFSPKVYYKDLSSNTYIPLSHSRYNYTITLTKNFKLSKNVFIRGHWSMAIQEEEGKYDPRIILNYLTGKQWVKHTISWFSLKIRPRKDSELEHPGKYPAELCERFIEFFSKKEQWIIDPFLGVGSTLISAKTLGRNGVGIELNPEFAEIAKKLHQDPLTHSTLPDTKQKVIIGDSSNLDRVLVENKFEKEQFQVCMTSPPYWNMLSKGRGGSNSQHRRRLEKVLKLTYSELENDIGNIESYEEYLNKIGNIFKLLQPFMRKKGWVIIIAQNILDEEGIMRPIAWDLARELSNIYVLKQEQIWCQTDKLTGIWGYPKTYISNVHHHYCLIFQNT